MNNLITLACLVVILFIVILIGTAIVEPAGFTAMAMMILFACISALVLIVLYKHNKNKEN